MDKNNPPVVILSTASSMEEATTIAHALVGERLAACCNLVPGMRSIFRWNGRIEEGEEVMIVIKSVEQMIDRLRDRLLELHSYDVPELVVLPVAAGLESYLQWITDNARMAEIEQNGELPHPLDPTDGAASDSAASDGDGAGADKANGG